MTNIFNRHIESHERTYVVSAQKVVHPGLKSQM